MPAIAVRAASIHTCLPRVRAWFGCLLLALCTVGGEAAETVTTCTLTPALVGRPYAGQLGSTTTAGPVTWAVVGGTLPAGLALDPATGVIGGTPSDAGEAAFTVAATNGGGTSEPRALTLRTQAERRVVQWGYDYYGAWPVPAGLDGVVALAAGDAHMLALRSDGTVVAWGDNNYGSTSVPAGLTGVSRIAAGSLYSLALKRDGTVVAWGSFRAGDNTVPAGLADVVGIAQGGGHSLALKRDGTVVAWGYNGDGQTDVPAGLGGVIALAAGSSHSVALKSDGTVVTWGGQVTLPAALGRVVAISAGSNDSMALRDDGTAVVWGDGSTGQTTVPAGLGGITAIATGGYHALALKGDATVVAWGSDTIGQATVPAGLGAVTAIASGREISLALGAIRPSISDTGPLTAVLGVPFSYRILASEDPTAYSVDGLPPGLTVDATSGVISGTPTALGSGSITLRAANAAGAGTATVTLPVVPTLVATYTLTPALVGVAYAADLHLLSAGPTTWAIASGALPAGLVLDPASGRISGTATASGLATFAVTAATPEGTGPPRTLTLRTQAQNAVVPWDAAAFAAVPAGLTTAVAVAVTYSHTMALRSDGTVVAWGANDSGETDVPGGLNGITAIAVGSGFSVALKDDGTVVAWGYDNVGQVDIPAGLVGVTAVAAGSQHAVALRSDGKVVAWGSNRLGQRVPPAGLSGVTAIAASGDHTLARKSSGTVVTWGDNATADGLIPTGLSGVTAIATGNDSWLALKSNGKVVQWGGSQLTPVPTGLTGVAAIATGYLHSVAVKADGSVVTWGTSTAGGATPPAGLASTATAAVGGPYTVTLSLVRPLLAPGGTRTAIAGLPFTHRIATSNRPAPAPTFTAGGLPEGLVLDPASGTISGAPLMAGGSTITLGAGNAAGSDTAILALTVIPSQIRTYTLTPGLVGRAYATTLLVDSASPVTWSIGSGTLPVGLTLDAASGVISGTPTVYDSAAFTVVATNASGVSQPRPLRLRILEERDVHCWGANDRGQSTVPAGLDQVVAITAGQAFTAALRSDGTVAAWGSNSNGQLVIPAGLHGVTAIAAGAAHLVALQGDGTVAAWGWNSAGQATVPAGLTSITAIAASYDNSVALRADGTLAVWGGNDYLQLTIPAGLPAITAIASGSRFFVALKDDGTLATWGRVSEGQATYPAGLAGVAAIAAGSQHTLALRGDGTVAAWGGSLSATTTVPAAATGITAIAASNDHSLALRDNGSVVAWGGNGSGQSDVPGDLTRVVAVAAGDAHSAVLGTRRPVFHGSTTVTAVSGLPFSHRIVADNHPTAFNVDALPAGLSLDASTGVISGTPVDLGTSIIGVIAGNASGVDGSTLVLHVVPALIGTYTLTPGLVGRPYAATLAAQSATPCTWSLAAGALPAGLALDPASGALSGTPLAAADAVFSVIATCAAGTTAPRPLALHMRPERPLAAWGSDALQQLRFPSALDGVVAIAAGGYHGLTLLLDGTVRGWGSNGNGQATIPAGLGQVTAIAGGRLHSLALRADGTVTAWGYAGDGATGVPADLLDAVAIDAGDYHSVALTGAGTVRAWGRNTSGQATVPAGLGGVVAVAAGGKHTAALQTDGTVVCWGDNSAGQSTVPAGLTGVIAIATGNLHTLALKADGTVVTWGSGASGLATIPPDLAGVVAIAAGDTHSIALRGDGTAVIWGGNGAGQATIPTGLAGITAITAGSAHTLALGGRPPHLTVPGMLGATLGQSFSHQLTASDLPTAFSADGLPDGLAVDPATGLISGTPTVAGAFSTTLGASNGFGTDSIAVTFTVLPTVTSWTLVPGLVGEAYNATLTTGASGTATWAIASGSLPAGTTLAPGGVISGTPTADGEAAFTVTVSIAGATSAPWPLRLRTLLHKPLVAWGDERFGQSRIPSRLTRVVGLADGLFHSLALRADGTVVEWPAEGDGRGPAPAGLAGVTAISIGSAHSLALKGDGTVVAWGYDGSGQTDVPSGLAGVVAIAAGWDHSVALKGDGTVVAWGSDWYGQATVPAGLVGVVAIAAGDMHTVALKADGTVVAWGNDDSGQCSPPVGLDGVTAIAAGFTHTVALTATGAPVAWGSSSRGEQGFPTGLDDVTAIAAGYAMTLAVHADGTVSAWGLDDYGQTTLPADLSHVTLLAAGPQHVLALGDAPPVLYAPTSLNATVGLHFTFQIDASGEPTAYDASGLPDGLALDPASGLISGTPTTSGVFTVSLSASNAGSSSVIVILTVDPPAPVITSALTLGGTVGVPLTYQITATNGPTAFGASGLPGGLTLDPATGVISGTPTGAGGSTVTLSASNVTGSGTAELILTIAPPAPVITSPLTLGGTVGVPLTYQITASHGPTAFSADNLPAGVTLDPATGLASGTPTIAGTRMATIHATNAGGTGSAVVTVTVAPAAGTNTDSAGDDSGSCGAGSGLGLMLTLALIARRRRRTPG